MYHLCLPLRIVTVKCEKIYLPSKDSSQPVQLWSLTSCPHEETLDPRLYLKMVQQRLSWVLTSKSTFSHVTAHLYHTVSPLYIGTRNAKIRYNDNLNVRKHSQEVMVNEKLCKKTLHKIFKQHMFWIFVRIASERRF